MQARQVLLRHANVSTTQNLYTKRVDRKAVAAMQLLETALNEEKASVQ